MVVYLERLYWIRMVLIYFSNTVSASTKGYNREYAANSSTAALFFGWVGLGGSICNPRVLQDFSNKPHYFPHMIIVMS